MILQVISSIFHGNIQSIAHSYNIMSIRASTLSGFRSEFEDLVRASNAPRHVQDMMLDFSALSLQFAGSRNDIESVETYSDVYSFTIKHNDGKCPTRVIWSHSRGAWDCQPPRPK
jgi:hypothetical protein